MLPRIALARPSQPFPPAALALVALAFILPGLAGHDLWKSHDAIGLGLVHEMARSGDLVVPRLAGVAWLNDPPLYHWAALAFGAALDSLLEFHAAARLASGAFLLAAFWLIYRAAGQWADRTAAVAAMLEPAVGVLPVSDDVVHAIALVIALLIVVFLHMVIGEMAPKNVAIASPERSAMALAHVFRGYVIVFKPLIIVLNAIANGVLRLFGVKTADSLDVSGLGMTREQVDENAKTYTEQVFKILDRERTEIVFNSTWMDKLTAADIVKLAATHTVADGAMWACGSGSTCLAVGLTPVRSPGPVFVFRRPCRSMRQSRTPSPGSGGTPSGGSSSGCIRRR